MSAAILAAGYLNLDVVCRVEMLPPWDGRVTAHEIDLGQGGMSANFACAAARLGARVRFFGHAGTDALGDAAVAALEACGVDAGAVVRAPGGGTIAVVLVDRVGRRIVVSEPFEFDWRPLDAALAAPAAAAALHVDGYTLPAALDRARRARDAGLLASADLDGLEPADEVVLAQAARSFDVLLLNRGHAAAVGADATELAERLARENPIAVCITLGGDGAIVASAGTVERVPPFPVRPIDTTGAGDVFAAAFVYRLLEHDSPRAAARFASAAAALSTTARGARGRLPRVEEVMAVLEERKREREALRQG